MKKNLADFRFKVKIIHPSDYPKFEDCLTITVIYESESRSVAEALFLISYKDKTVKPLEVGVEIEYRRQGIGTKIYCLAEEASGFRMIPSDDASEDADLFWSQKNRPFGK